MSDQVTAPSLSRKGNQFDSKKLGKLEQARKAMSMDAEHARSRLWQVTPSLEAHGSNIRNSQASTSTLSLTSLRSLESSPTKHNAINSSIAPSDRDVMFPPATVVAEGTFPLGGESHVQMRTLTTPDDVSCMHPDFKHFSPDNSCRTDSRRPCASSRTVEPTSFRQGVDEKTLVALSELGRRRCKDSPPVLLPTNRPFLVGESANRLASKQAVESAVLQPMENPRNEAPSITVLSKLLFFGGMTPLKVSQSIQSTDAVSSPEATIVSQSDSSNEGEVKHSYLLQLGHIMGEVSPQQLAVQSRSRDFEDTSSAISSLDHPVETQGNELRSQRPGHTVFLYLLLFVASVVWVVPISGHALFERNGHVFEQMKERMILRRCHLAEQVRATLANFYDKKQAWIKMVEWQNETLHLYANVVDFIMEPTNPPEQMIRRNQCTACHWWVPPVVISTAVLIPEETRSLPERIHPTRQWDVDFPSANETLAEDPSVLTKSVEMVREAVTLLKDLGSGLLHETSLNDSSGHSDSMTRCDQFEPETVNQLFRPPTNANVSVRLERKPEVHSSQLADFVGMPSDGSPSKHVSISGKTFKSTSSFWSRPEAAALALNLGIVKSEYKRRQQRFSSDNVLSCVFAQTIASRYQCLPIAGGRTICCEPFSPDEVYHIASLDENDDEQEEDEFLQKPLVDVVVDFFHERRERRQERRRERKWRRHQRR